MLETKFNDHWLEKVAAGFRSLAHFLDILAKPWQSIPETETNEVSGVFFTAISFPP
jgi:hypothetical protein